MCSPARCFATLSLSLSLSLFAGWNLEGSLAEREGFEPSVQVLARTTVWPAKHRAFIFSVVLKHTPQSH